MASRLAGWLLESAQVNACGRLGPQVLQLTRLSSVSLHFLSASDADSDAAVCSLGSNAIGLSYSSEDSLPRSASAWLALHRHRVDGAARFAVSDRILGWARAVCFLQLSSPECFARSRSCFDLLQCRP